MTYFQLKRIALHPIRTMNIFSSRFRSFRWDKYAEKIREPKKIKNPGYERYYVYSEEIEDTIYYDLQKHGIDIEHIVIGEKEFEKYSKSILKIPFFTPYFDLYRNAVYKKILELYLTDRIFSKKFSNNGTYIDVGSEYSVAPRYLREKYSLDNIFELDKRYKTGIHGYKIGADAGNIPLNDTSVSGMFLHCSLEHFENDNDIQFIKEANRLLTPSGWILISPLYLHVNDTILTDPVISVPHKTSFGDLMVFCLPNLWNSYMRLMSSSTLKKRILHNLHPGKVKVIRINNAYSLSMKFNEWIFPYHLYYEKDV